MLVSEITYIYGLCEPTTGELRYIGKSVSPNNRFRRHISDVNKYNSYKDRWIRGLISENKKPSMFIIDVVNKEEWVFWERFYISYFNYLGCRLTNTTGGGDEPPTTKGRKHTEESKRKMSKSKKGKPIPWLNNGEKRSEEHKQNLSNSLKGRVSEKKGKSYDEIYGDGKSKKLRKLLSESHKGIHQGEKHPMFGKKHSQESIEKIKEKRKQQVFTKESIEKRAKKLKTKVYKYSLDGNLVKEFDSITEATNEISYKLLNKHTKSGEPYKGYIWKKQVKKKKIK